MEAQTYRKRQFMHNFTDNLYFRQFKCNLTIEETAKLCFKNVSTVTKWDQGRNIPKECRRLMKLYSQRQLDPNSDKWEQWKIERGSIVMPSGKRLTPEQIELGQALIEIDALNDKKTKTMIMKTARKIANAINRNENKIEQQK